MKYVMVIEIEETDGYEHDIENACWIVNSMFNDLRELVTDMVDEVAEEPGPWKATYDRVNGISSFKAQPLSEIIAS